MSEAEIEAVVTELMPLVGLPLQRIIQPDEHTLALRFLRQWVTLAAHPQLSRVHPLARAPVAPQTPPAFCMLLRKVLLNRRLIRLHRGPNDRIVFLEMAPGCLVAELMGRRSNLVLMDSLGVVAGSLKPRLLRNPVGSPYSPPSPGPASPRRLTCRFASGDDARLWFEQRLQQRAGDVLARRCKRLLRRARKTLRQVEGDLQRCSEADNYKKWADLLLAHQHQLTARGQSSVRVPDLFEDGASLDIPLDPALDVSKNAQRLYKKQRRLKKGVVHVAARLDQARARTEALSLLQERLAEAPEDQLEELADLLEELDPRPRQLQVQGSPGQRPAKDAPFRTFQAADGSSILVGKSARHNHTLTFHHARGRDTWLHLRDLPGAHGVIRAGKSGEVSHETLLDAATLVAYFSGIKDGEDADVSHALRKNVRPADKPGQVYVSRSRTLHVVVKRERLDRLMGKKR